MNATSDLVSNYFAKLQANPVVSAVLSGEHFKRLSALCRRAEDSVRYGVQEGTEL
jgi:hypothetical protein